MEDLRKAIYYKEVTNCLIWQQ